jgi:hypothetical protein
MFPVVTEGPAIGLIGDPNPVVTGLAVAGIRVSGPIGVRSPAAMRPAGTEGLATGQIAAPNRAVTAMPPEVPAIGLTGALKRAAMRPQVATGVPATGPIGVRKAIAIVMVAATAVPGTGLIAVRSPTATATPLVVLAGVRVTGLIGDPNPVVRGPVVAGIRVSGPTGVRSPAAMRPVAVMAATAVTTARLGAVATSGAKVRVPMVRAVTSRPTVTSRRSVRIGPARIVVRDRPVTGTGSTVASVDRSAAVMTATRVPAPAQRRTRSPLPHRPRHPSPRTSKR